ncbi:MAG: hypothetical protein ACFFKA_16145 [Candidatus Thorarchaeota archaeon]
MSREKSSSFENLCEIYLLYFDEVIGHVLLLNCPETTTSLDSTKTNIIMHHPIWFLDLKDDKAINRIDLEYNGIMYFARKFIVASQRTKKRSGSANDQYDTIILILTLSADLDIFGGELLNTLTNSFMNEFNDTLSEVIESEIAKLELIKNETILQKIEIGDKTREKVKESIKSVCEKYFSSVIRQKDGISIKLQKAISYLIFKGIDIDHIVRHSREKEFSNIRLFDYTKNGKTQLNAKEKFKLMRINPIPENQEFELLIKNVHNKPLINLICKVTYIRDFFEKEILNESIEKCLPDEELILSAPIPEKVNEFIFSIENHSTRKKLFTRKIKLD